MERQLATILSELRQTQARLDHQAEDSNRRMAAMEQAIADNNTELMILLNKHLTWALAEAVQDDHARV